MFNEYVQTPSIRHVAKKYGVAELTVRRYRKWEDWDRKRDDVLRAAQKEILQNASKVMGIHQRMHVQLSQLAEEALKKKRLTGARVTAKMLDTLARTGSFLFEEDERRPDQVIRIDFGPGVAFNPNGGKGKKKDGGNGERKGKPKVDAEN